MKKILLVTNDVPGSQNFIAELLKRYDVEVVGYIKAALYRLKKPENFGLVIIEVSMPSLDLYGLEETSNGDKTGIVFYEKDVKHLNLPIIFWSWTDEFRDEISELDGRDIIFVKKDADDNHLLIAVTEFVGGL
jgi:CheY-like chemotaxis protein